MWSNSQEERKYNECVFLPTSHFSFAIPTAKMFYFKNTSNGWIQSDKTMSMSNLYHVHIYIVCKM